MRRLTSTTSLVAALSLAVPSAAPVFAQQNDLPTCTIDGDLPCMVGDVVAESPEDVLELLANAEAAVDAQAEEQAVAGSDAPAEAPAEDVTEQAQSAAPQESATPPETAEQQAETVAEANADAAAEAAPETEELPQVEAEAEAETTAEAPTEDPQPAPAAQDNAAANSAAAESAEAETAPAPEAAVEAEVEAEAEAEPEIAAETEAAPDPDAQALEEALEAEQAAPTEEAQTDAAPAEESQEPEAATNETESAEDTVGEDTAAKSVTAPETEAAETTEVIVDDTAPPAAAAAAAGDGNADAQVVEEDTVEVTEEDTRTSSEDFDTQVAAEGDATAAPAPQTEEERDGLSNFEKALLIGLGGAVVGTLLNNGDEVVSSSGDRVVVRRNGELRVLKDDDALLRQSGTEIRTQTYTDGSTRTIATRENGVQIITVRANDGRVLRRERVDTDGRVTVLFDDMAAVEPVSIAELPEPELGTQDVMSSSDIAALRSALSVASAQDAGRRFNLAQVRQIEQVRDLAPVVTLDGITFATGSSAIRPEQAQALLSLGRAIEQVVAESPGAVFLIEGHTDAVGDAGYNLALSDRRAESVALALTEYFDIPPENLVTQGYGEANLKVETLEAEQANRRAAIRNITRLLGSG